MACFSLAALTVVGLLPLSVFISKWYLSLVALAAGEPLLVMVLLVSSMLNAAYFLPMVVAAFFGGKKDAKQVFAVSGCPGQPGWR